MRETRQSGSEGGARFIPCPYPYPCEEKVSMRLIKERLNTP